MSAQASEVVRAELSRPEARERFARSRVWALRRRSVEGIELVHLPLWVFEAHIETASEECHSVLVAVDGIDGTVRVIDRDVRIESRALRVLPPLLGEREARERFDTEFPIWLLRVSRAGARASKLRERSSRGLVAYPCWVEHALIGPKRTIRALDATSGAWFGARGRAAILRGFLGDARQGEGREGRRPEGD